MKDGCEFAETTFMRQNLEHVKDKSGSCAIVCMLTDTHAYIANVGDSRAIMSRTNGAFVESLSRDHKPSDPVEQKRICMAGGRIY